MRAIVSMTALLVVVSASTVPAAAQQPRVQSDTQPQPHMGPIPGPGPDTLGETSNPYRSDLRAIREGRRLFNWYNCSGCHGDHAGGGMGPSLRDSTWVYGGTEARIFRSIADGRTKGMPSWGRTLPADQIWKLVAYIKTLGTAKEPDKPDKP
jgi:mono/diheme cytochrome c family protein